MAEKVVLAYSGGLDTSVAIRWLQETYGMEVITLTVDIGNERTSRRRRPRAGHRRGEGAHHRRPPRIPGIFRVARAARRRDL